MKTKWTAISLALTLICSSVSKRNTNTEQSADFVTIFKGSALVPTNPNPHVEILNPGAEKFFVHVPAAYDGTTPFGLVVYTDPDDEIDKVPHEWMRVLDSRRFLFIAAEKAGNNQYISRRLGLAVLGALEMTKHYHIDPSRVYAAGFSGGARMSGMLGFFQPDIFRGTIQNSGADFYKPVPQVLATSLTDTIGKPYGIFDATADEIAQAHHVRFALITGTNDFRRGNILDIYAGGFAKEGFDAKIFDVPGMGHEICSATTLSAALDFLDGSR